MSEVQGNGGAVATGEKGAAPLQLADVLKAHRMISDARYRFLTVDDSPEAMRFEGEARERELQIANAAIDRFRYSSSPQRVPCLCCENPPQIRSNPSDAMKDATLHGVGMWKR